MLIVGVLLCAAMLLVLIRPPSRVLARVAVIAVGAAGLVLALLGHSQAVAAATAAVREEARARLMTVCEPESGAIQSYLLRFPDPNTRLNGPDRVQAWLDLKKSIDQTWSACTGNHRECPPSADPLQNSDLERLEKAFTSGDGCAK